MEQLLSARMPGIAPTTDGRVGMRCERQRFARGRSVTTLSLVLHVVGVAALVAASVAAIADQSAKFVSGQEIVGVHEIPSFIADRVELPPGLSADDPAAVAPGASAGRPLGQGSG
jgi:hypothetical protein